MNMQVEMGKAKYLSIGLCSITMLVYTKQVSDPVNAPKFLLLGIVSLASVATLLVPEIKHIWFNFKWVFVASLAMIFFMIISSVLSPSPLSQNIYGVYGRNTGLLTHVALLGILLSILTFKSSRSILIVFKGMLVAGLLNVGYCAWVLVFGDFISWTNPYKSLLGTLGNPNFVSSYLALFGVGVVALYLSESVSLRKILAVTIIVIILIFQIIKTNSTQGLIVLLMGIYMVVFFVLAIKIRKLWLTFSYAAIGLLTFIFGVLGLVNSGPLASLLFQNTLAYRREYWVAGIRMGMDFPITGVGLDSYGDWYRQLRTVKSTIEPGIQVVTNVAHNVYIDAFANGGFPLLLAYLTLSFITLGAIIKVTRQLDRIDPLFVAISSTWIAYQLQSLISINQIGLSIWGWALAGMILAFSAQQIDASDEKPFSNRNRRISNSRNLLNPVAMTIGALAGFILFSPPVLADHKWTSAYSHKNADELFASLQESYFNPSTSFQLAQAIQIFESNGFAVKAHKLAIDATKFNRRSFDAWQQLYSLQAATTEEKKIAKGEMMKLDPLNHSIKEYD